MGHAVKNLIAICVFVLTSGVTYAQSDIVIDVGTELSFKLSQNLNYKETPTGSSFRANMTIDVISDDGDILIDEGATLIGTVKDAQKKKLVIQMEKIKIGKKYVNIVTSPIEVKMSGAGKAVIKGAVVGGMIGRAAGGKKGRRKGAATAAGLSAVGAAAAVLTLPKGQVLKTNFSESLKL